MFRGLVQVLLLLALWERSDGQEHPPSEAPMHLSLVKIKGRQAVLHWLPVDPETLRGSFQGYLVRTWNHAGSQIYAFPPDVTSASVDFFPFSKNFVTVAARNEKYVGPQSAAISFDAPQIAPSPPHSLTAFPLSDTAALLQWSKPLQPNGILLGYNIYHAHQPDPLVSINDPDKTQAKITGLKEGVLARIVIAAVNCAGASERAAIDITTPEAYQPQEPFPPRFVYKINYTTTSREERCYSYEKEAWQDGREDDYYDDLMLNESKKKMQVKAPNDGKCLFNCMVMWLPDVHNSPGEHFFVKYRVKGDKGFVVSKREEKKDFLILEQWDACKNYEVAVVSVDGNFTTESGLVTTPTKLP